jgi:hypothetical protein
MLSMILFSSAVALQLAIAIVLVRNYLRTRDIGFVWLGMAVLIWLLLSPLLDLGRQNLIDRKLKGQPVGVFPFNLVQHGQMTIGNLFTSISLLNIVIGASLLLVAVLYLGKTRINSKPPTLA